MASSIKPTGYPLWASVTPTGITEPSEAKKQTGWQSAEKPAAQYMNWLQEKSSAWLRYLSYDNIILDDFVRSNKSYQVLAVPSGQVTTGFAPFWDVNYPVTFAQADDAPGSQDGIGVALTYIGHSGRAFMEALVPPINDKDFLLETVLKRAYLGSSGAQLIVGAYPGSSNCTGVGAWWSTTGPSSPWFFNYGYSQTPTTFDTAIGPYSPSGYQTLIVEKRGSTLVAQINGQQVAALGVGGTLMGYVNAGMRMVNATGDSDLAIDKFRFGVRR